MPVYRKPTEPKQVEEIAACWAMTDCLTLFALSVDLAAKISFIKLNIAIRSPKQRALPLTFLSPCNKSGLSALESKCFILLLEKPSAS